MYFARGLEVQLAELMFMTLDDLSGGGSFGNLKLVILENYEYYVLHMQLFIITWSIVLFYLTGTSKKVC